MLDRRLKIGTFWGIELYVHWTFALLILFFAYQASGQGIIAILFSIAIVLGVFFCVTLHEYGHALAARRFGVPTIDITLLPIGGVARLQRMPRVPWQELVVAVAGPAVNVVIATLLAIGFFLIGGLPILLADGSSQSEEIERAISAFGEPSIWQFALVMMVVNVTLVLFNMIPAFPMDGGRVFRSLLAMVIDYRRATIIASRVGLVCAVAMAATSVTMGDPNPFLILIAIFIAFAGMAEARQVEVTEAIRGLRVGHVMINCQDAIPMTMPLGEIVHYFQSTRATAMPVVSLVGTVIGMIQLEDLSSAVSKGVDPTTTAAQLVNRELSDGAVALDEELESVITRLGSRGRQLPVVDHQGRLLGILDLGSILLRGRMARHLPNASMPDDRFDALS